MNLFGNFTRGELVGAALATTVFGVGVMIGQLLPAVFITAVIVVWTFTPTRRRPFRLIVPSAVRWSLRRDRTWSAPMRGPASVPSFLRGMEVQLADGDGGLAPIGVVACRRSYTVMFSVDRAALTFSSEAEQAQALAGWGEVLGALCVERQTELTAERVGWTDLHRAADPAALVRYHDVHGVDGPASADYRDHLATFGTLAAEHDVVVWATVTQAGRFRLAKRAGMRGSVTDVMHGAAITAGTTLRGELADRGFTVGPLMSPVDIGRLVTHGMDPYRPLEPRTGRERFALGGAHDPGEPSDGAARRGDRRSGLPPGVRRGVAVGGRARVVAVEAARGRRAEGGDDRVRAGPAVTGGPPARFTPVDREPQQRGRRVGG